MNFQELIRHRQSTRRYAPGKIPADVINRCIEAARLAPSACNSQPWTFIVTDEEGAIKELARRAFSGIYNINTFAKDASALITIVTERSKYAAKLGGYFKGTQYSLIDIGIASAHFMLQAEEEGLGTCMLGWFNEKEVKKFLGLPKDKKVDVMICLGYPAEPSIRGKKRKALEEVRLFKNPPINSRQ